MAGDVRAAAKRGWHVPRLQRAQLQALLSHLALSAGDSLHQLFTPARQLLHSGPGALVKSYGGYVGEDAPAPLPREETQQCLLFTDCLLCDGGSKMASILSDVSALPAADLAEGSWLA